VAEFILVLSLLPSIFMDLVLEANLHLACKFALTKNEVDEKVTVSSVQPVLYPQNLYFSVYL
jgi:hypothetical protein